MMAASEALEKARAWTDEEIVERVKAGETALYEILMRRYNQRLYRVTVSIVRDSSEAEDVVQAAYVRAYGHLGQFERRAPFSAWLTRIAVNEALARVRTRNQNEELETAEDGKDGMKTVDKALDPEERAACSETAELLEAAVLQLPEQYRTVVMLRDVEEMSTKETAEALDLSEENVKVRLHRGHAAMQDWLLARVGAEGRKAFPFMGQRCDSVVSAVLRQLP
jgi:RNA polymerase sigma-70 factor (ECF subfamily)